MYAPRGAEIEKFEIVFHRAIFHLTPEVSGGKSANTRYKVYSRYGAVTQKICLKSLIITTHVSNHHSTIKIMNINCHSGLLHCTKTYQYHGKWKMVTILCKNSKVSRYHMVNWSWWNVLYICNDMEMALFVLFRTMQIHFYQTLSVITESTTRPFNVSPHRHKRGYLKTDGGVRNRKGCIFYLFLYDHSHSSIFCWSISGNWMYGQFVNI